MREKVALVLKLACLGLGALVALEVRDLFRAMDSLVAFEPAGTPGVRGTRDGSSGKERPAVASGEHGGAGTETAGTPATETGAAPGRPVPQLPPQYRGIDSSGVFGIAQVPKPAAPALLGIAGGFVFLRTVQNKEVVIEPGATVDGIRVLAIATNRVLVEQGGHRFELTLFDGIGSDSLLPKEKGTKP